MKITQKQARARLFKKLSALRATLSNEERDILDSLVTDEVQAHKISFAKVAAKRAKATAKTAEVNAHQMNLAKATAKNSAKSAAKATEVNAHGMNLAKNAAKTSAKSAAKTTAKAARQQIRFNPTIEEYEQVEE